MDYYQGVIDHASGRCPMRFPLAVWPLIAGLTLAPRLLSAPPDPAADERLLQSAHVAADGRALLDFLTRRSATTANPEQVGRLLRSLVDGPAEQADRAAGELVSLGPLVLPRLRAALNDPAFARGKARITECLK